MYSFSLHIMYYKYTFDYGVICGILFTLLEKLDTFLKSVCEKVVVGWICVNIFYEGPYPRLKLHFDFFWNNGLLPVTKNVAISSSYIFFPRYGWANNFYSYFNIHQEESENWVLQHTSPGGDGEVMFQVIIIKWRVYLFSIKQSFL